MKFVVLDTDMNRREMTQHGHDDFPVAIYLRHMNRKDEGNLILHWHDEIQFVISLKGPTYYTVCDTSYILKDGDCLFVNSRCLHTARPLDTEGGDFFCIDIHPRFLHTDNNLLNQKYINPLLASSTMSSILFDGSKPWHTEAKDLLNQIVELIIAEPFGYEMEILSIMTKMWLFMVRDCQDEIACETMLSQTEQERLDRVTHFIEAHYQEHIALTDIAEAAAVSTAECCRFMKRTLGYSPMTYLNNFRIIQSTLLLKKTSMSISEIAQAVGFGSSSYFTERFKKTMNCKPMEYRRKGMIDRSMKESLSQENWGATITKE